MDLNSFTGSMFGQTTFKPAVADHTDLGCIAVECLAGTIWLQGNKYQITGASFVEPASLSQEPPTDLLIEARNQLEAYFVKKLKFFDLPLRMEGTTYQKRVWAALGRIPYGRTDTYGGMAAQLPDNTTARAVGTACAKNPIPIIVPCHRVIAGNGKLTGYLGGLPWKHWLLELESAPGLFGRSS